MSQIRLPNTGLGKRKKLSPLPKQQNAAQPQTQEPNLNQVLRMRKDIFKDLKSGKANGDDLAGKVQNAGIQDPLAIETILSEDLNENVIRYFLGQANNNPKKARMLARKFGFEV